LVLAVIYTLISISSKVERGALLTSGVVTAYCVYLCVSAVLSEPNKYCQALVLSDGQVNLPTLIIGMIIAILSIGYSTLNASSKKSTFSLEQSNLIDQVNHEEHYYSFTYFHLVFAAASMYMGMLLISWDVANSALSISKFTYDNGWISVWIKVAAQWLTSILYTWSLIAPLLCPNREWE